MFKIQVEQASKGISQSMWIAALPQVGSKIVYTNIYEVLDVRLNGFPDPETDRPVATIYVREI